MLIEIRRHSLKGKDEKKNVLSPEGIELARRIGAEEMRGKKFTFILTSGCFRTAQTVCAFAEGAGDFTVARFKSCDALDSQRMKEWGEYYKLHDANLVSCQLVDEEARRMADKYREELRELPSDAHVLGAGHTPFIECSVFGMTGTIIRPLGECEGVILDYDGSKFVLVEEIRL